MLTIYGHAQATWIAALRFLPWYLQPLKSQTLLRSQVVTHQRSGYDGATAELV